MASTVRPAVARRLPTALSLVLGDPCAARAVAATTRFVDVSWLATERQPHARSLAQLAAARRLACENTVPSWRAARGPIAVADLDLQRIGWSWVAPVTLVTDIGDVIAASISVRLQTG